MKQYKQRKLGQRAALAAALTLCTVPASQAQTRSVSLIPFRDPMPDALPRWWDVGNRQFNAFVSSTRSASYQAFSYSKAQVVVTYDPNQPTRYFTGSIEARGLKPNFWYQMKLVGKPQYGSRGWGSTNTDGTTNGNDWANGEIGYAGRWWGDTTNNQWNIDSDLEYENTYGSAEPGAKRTVYGYIYMAGFLTDENGNYSGLINGTRSFHVTWQDWQYEPINKNVVALDTTNLGSSSSYGYGYTFAAGATAYSTSTRSITYNPVKIYNPVKLWYEYESRPGRVRPNTTPITDATGHSYYQVNLPSGNYNCRFVLTEESFHNNFGGGTNNSNGGFWLTVMANEDFTYNKRGQIVAPDRNSANDIVFSIQ